MRQRSPLNLIVGYTQPILMVGDFNSAPWTCQLPSNNQDPRSDDLAPVLFERKSMRAKSRELILCQRVVRVS
jgi:endonuclease/exonuclease/phosphatase (EEP) superfamily protein YafD